MNLEKLLRDTKRSLSDKDIFCSSEMQDYLTYKAKLIHKDWNNPSLPVEVVYKPHIDGIVAYTDNQAYVLNAGNPMITGTTEEKLKLVCGLLYHEIGHRLFTSFLAMYQYSGYMEKGKIYPGRPEMSILYSKVIDEIYEFIKDKGNGRKLEAVMHRVCNILEDGRIEYFLLSYSEKYATLANGLIAMREVMYEELDDCKQIMKKRDDGELYPFEAFMQLLLHYVRFGEIKGFDTALEKDPIITLFDLVQEHTDACIEARTSMEFYLNLNKIMVKLWPQIKEYIQSIEENRKDEGQKNSQSQDESNDGTGSSDNSESQDGPGSSSSSQPSADEVASEINKRLSSLQGTSEDASGQTGAGSDEEAVSSKLGEDEDMMAKDLTPPPAYTRTTSIGGSGSGMTTYVKGHTEDSNTKVDLKRIVNAVSERKVDQSLEEKIKQDLTDFDRSLDYSVYHRNIDCTFVRHAVAEADRMEYQKISPELVRIAKNLASRSDFFPEDDSPMLVKSQYYGKKFNAASLGRQDYRYFSKDVYLEEAPTIAVGVCIDESGSMHGVRSQSAKAMAITIYEYCSIMDIPISVIGHTTNGSGVIIYDYADFDKPDPNDRYRLMNISARRSNRDGYAIRFLMAKLEEQPAQSKLLIIVSDGQPAADGYTGSAANADLRDIVEHCEKNDIGLIAAAIGDDKPTIKGIYGEKHFLDITDLTKMPMQIANVIRRLLK